MTEKVVNYTDEMVARLHAVYDGEATDEVRKAQIKELAEELGKSEASIRAKLTREGIYVKLTQATAGKAGKSKAQLVQEIANKIGADEDVIGSLEKATKVALNHVLNAL